MDLGDTLKKLRQASGLTQEQVAAHVMRHSGRSYTLKAVSGWETGIRTPGVEQFLLLCELYSVRDIQKTFRGKTPEYRNLSRLNKLGRSRVEEYIAFLSASPLFAEQEDSSYNAVSTRIIPLYDVPAAAGYGSFLDSDAYEDLEVDETVPQSASYALRVSGDSMEPRFVPGQIVFVHTQPTLDVGEVGVFSLNGDSYIKKLGRGELVSLNPRYAPIKLREYDSLYIFGKVVG